MCCKSSVSVGDVTPYASEVTHPLVFDARSPCHEANFSNMSRVATGRGLACMQRSYIHMYMYCTYNTNLTYDVKLNTPKDQHCDKISVNHVKNSLRQVLPYLTNKSSTKCGNWCDGKA